MAIALAFAVIIVVRVVHSCVAIAELGMLYILPDGDATVCSEARTVGLSQPSPVESSVLLLLCHARQTAEILRRPPTIEYFDVAQQRRTLDWQKGNVSAPTSRNP